MKYVTASILLIIWMLLTLLLAISFIGLIVLADEDTAWHRFPEKLLMVFEK